jgi:pimeloyl-ACP methyl ester carboxylesterase
VKATVAVLVAVALTAGGCSSAPAPMAFGACPASMDAARAQVPAERAAVLEFGCSRISVPVRWEDPSGEQLTLTVARVRHRSQVNSLGSLILLSGGPGQSGLELASTGAKLLPTGLLERFDVIAYDPRGVGESAGINCGTPPADPALSTPLDVRTASGLAVVTEANRRYAVLCAQRLGARAGAFSTAAAVRDLDALRLALGDERLTSVGYSYGAKVGAQYAHRFPDRVRALVLDAPSDPRTDWATTVRRQVRGFEETFDEYAAGCASRADCARLGDPRAFVADLVGRAFAQPIPSARRQDTEPANGYDVLRGVAAALYDDARWPDLDAVLYETRYGDSGGIFAMMESVSGPHVTDPKAPDPDDANYVINCTDAAPGPSDAEVVAVATAMASESPLFGPTFARHLTGCREWSAPRVVLELPTAPSTAAPVVVVGTRHDPATPYAGAVSLAEVLGHAVLLTYEGESHTAMGQSACVDHLVERYLVDLQVPPDGSRCVD